MFSSHLLERRLRQKLALKQEPKMVIDLTRDSDGGHGFITAKKVSFSCTNLRVERRFFFLLSWLPLRAFAPEQKPHTCFTAPEFQLNVTLSH